MREKLLDEERIAAGPNQDLRCQLVGTRAQALDQGDTVIARQGRELSRCHVPPGRSFLEQLRTCKSKEEDRPLRCREIVDQVEERGLGPMQVLEHQDERLLFGEGLEEPTNRPEGFSSGG